MTANLRKPRAALAWAIIAAAGCAAGLLGGALEWGPVLVRAVSVWLVFGLGFAGLIAFLNFRRQRAALRNLLGALEQSQSALMIVNLEGRVEYANAGLCHQLGRSRRDLVGRPVRDLQQTGTSPDLIADMLANVRAGRSWQGEWPNRRGGGETYPVRCFVTPVTGPDGTTVCFVSVLEDMTDVRRSEATLRAAVERAEAADRTKGRFMATMSHEVRTPLNGIIGFTSLLLETPLTPEQREYVQTIRTSGEALIQLTSDILDFARIESGGMKLEPKPTNLRACVEDTMDILAVPASQKKLELLHWVGSDVPAAVMVDDFRLRQVLSNLVSNAVKFTASGTVEVLLEAEPVVSPAHVSSRMVDLTFTVRDTGIGIAPEHHTILFKPFSQVDESTTRRYGGNGLGLAISQNIVQLMGGEIIVKSEPERGSEFRFTIAAEAVPGVVRQIPDLGGLRIALAARPGPFAEHFRRLADRWRVDLSVVDSPAELPKSGWDIAFVDLDEELALRFGTGSGDRAPWPAAKTYGFTSVSLGADLRSALRGQFCQLINRPLHHDALLGLLAGIKSEPVAETPQTGKFGLSVLIVEDNLVNQRLVQKLLSNLGCRPALAGNGRIALEQLAKPGARFDLVLMDLHMPELDGQGAIERIRAGAVGEQARGLWITVLTADARPEQRERVMAVGANDYLIKPVSVGTLRRV